MITFYFYYYVTKHLKFKQKIRLIICESINVLLVNVHHSVWIKRIVTDVGGYVTKSWNPKLGVKKRIKESGQKMPKEDKQEKNKCLI